MSGPLFSLHGKVALVTGASRGLGRAMAMALADAGADVAVHGATTAPAAVATAIADATGRRTAALRADLSSSDAAGGLVTGTIDALGRLDIVVNNAGTIRRKPAADHDDAFWDEVIAVNLSSVFRLSRAAGRHFLDHQQPGKIINIASLLAFQGGITVPGYAAAKGGVVQLTKALANEWASQRINVNAIAPGYMETDNTKALREDPVRFKQISDRIPAGRWGLPEDLAGAVVFLASPAADYVHGHVLIVDGGWMGR